MMNALLEKCPVAAQKLDDWGKLPLHYAVTAEHHGQKKKVGRPSMNEDPEQCAKKDNDAMVPLHFAGRELTSYKVISVLLESYPQAALEAKERVSLAAVNALLTVKPDSIQVREYNGKKEMVPKEGFNHSARRAQAQAHVETPQSFVHLRRMCAAIA